MNFFDEATLRLKQQLQVKTDKEAAQVLGLSPRAWAGRKQGGAFPEKELRALAQQRPELQIDVHYVLTGEANHHVTGGRGSKAQELHDRLLTAAPALRDERALTAGVKLSESPAVQADEARLLAAFRAADSAGRAAILVAAQGIAALSTK